jgi:hypothetical protein
MSTDHPAVTDYIDEFDRIASVIPAARRTMLREEIVAHLRDAIPFDATDEEAAVAIAGFGTPEEIVANEREGGASIGLKRRRRWPWAVAALAVVGVTVAAFLIVPGLLVEKSIVTEEPYGQPRVEDGVAYYEYLDAVREMKYPLPAGAEYPRGVPEGLDPVEGTVGENGVGILIAHYTWICAWESEYLTAVELDDDERLVQAEKMIARWPFHPKLDSIADDWREAVVKPMEFGITTGIVSNRRATCSAAGILNVDGD